MMYRSAQNSALRPVPARSPGQMLPPVPQPLPGLLSVSACSLEQRGRPYILSH
jgi:hypothetical protein